MKILLLRFSSIGDIVLTTPVVRALKTQLPGIILHYCTKRRFGAVVEHNPYIDRCLYLESSLSALVNELRREKYDYIIDLHHNLRTRMIKLRLGVKAFSFTKLNYEKWLMVNFKINRLPGVHIVDRYLETARPLGVKDDGQGLNYFIANTDKVALTELPDVFQNGYTVYAIGGAALYQKIAFAAYDRTVR